ncbi:sigma factor-like helix-turn-helix DNA-binding protein [Brevibacillus marinus]|uniref:sigma factor-like helix-turn-helix DNA-binding protein n=1 Tax=Brevibacillus marinus TaxID=2496837 RepID=UPI000F84CA31|nr:sigma factor-like helix-turn-helix DNA-binding protein [Brevibacillus marinus]
MAQEKWLQLQAVYRKQIKHYRDQLRKLKEKETDLSFHRKPEDLDLYLRKNEILTMMNHCQLAYQQLGLRLGEKIDEDWLEILEPLEKKIFLLRFEQQLSFGEIKSLLGIPEHKTRQTFDRVIRKLLDHLSEHDLRK